MSEKAPYTYRDLIHDLAVAAGKHGPQVLNLPVMADDFTVSHLDYQPPLPATADDRAEPETLTMVLRD